MRDFIYPKSNRPTVEESAPLGKTLWVVGGLALALYLFFAVLILLSA